MKMAELERESRLPRTTIHYYLREGLLHPPTKSGKTAARYDRSHVDRLLTIESIKKDYVRDRKGKRVPLEYIRRRLDEDLGGSERSPARPRAGGGADEFERRREQLLEATIALLREKGYQQINVREISRAVGISPTTFYLYFQNKRELFMDVVDRLIDDTKRSIYDALRDEDNPLRKGAVWLQVFHEMRQPLGEITYQLVTGIASNDRASIEAARRIYGSMTDELALLLSEGTETGLMREVDVRLLAFIVVFLVEGIQTYASLYDDYSFEEAAILAFDWMVNGLAVKPEGEMLDIIDLDLLN